MLDRPGRPGGPGDRGQPGHRRGGRAALAAHGVAVLLTYLRLDPDEPYPDEYGKLRAAGGPLRHVAHPDEVAGVIVLLASHQARHITRQVVRMA